MSVTITISNLRNIKKLCFEIPDRGVWLLTASNGAGKTSLLACIRRIGYPNAFPVHFPSSMRSDILDNNSNSTITYAVNGTEVEYAYRGQRWTPRPRNGADLLRKTGYSSVTYVGATAERITPRPEDFTPRNLRAADPNIISAANDIFGTDKFSMLKTINLTRGAGNGAFVLALGSTKQAYHSEKNFSLGELCILKLLRLLNEVGKDSMIIIDELELALHPSAQVNLLRYLEKQSEEKSITVIFSTHSVTLLKSIKHNNIIYLEKKEDGETRSIVGCFPTYAIGNLASEEEALPDFIFYVEDLFARDILYSFTEIFLSDKYKDPVNKPTVKIIPIGAFDAVVAFLDRSRTILPAYVKQKAILDNDVKTETIPSWEKKSNHSQLAKFNKNIDGIKFLPFTPEVGVFDYIVDNIDIFQNKLRECFGDNYIQINQIVRNNTTYHTLTGSKRRQSAKKDLGKIIEYLVERSSRPSDAVQAQLCGIFAREAWSRYRKEFMELLGPVIT